MWKCDLLMRFWKPLNVHIVYFTAYILYNVNTIHKSKNCIRFPSFVKWKVNLYVEIWITWSCSRPQTDTSYIEKNPLFIYSVYCLHKLVWIQAFFVFTNSEIYATTKTRNDNRSQSRKICQSTYQHTELGRYRQMVLRRFNGNERCNDNLFQFWLKVQKYNQSLFMFIFCRFRWVRVTLVLRNKENESE